MRGPTHPMLRRRRRNGRPAQAQQPKVYLEPKWLRCLLLTALQRLFKGTHWIPPRTHTARQQARVLSYPCFKMPPAVLQSRWSRGVTVSTLDSESSDRGSNPREALQHDVHCAFDGVTTAASVRFGRRWYRACDKEHRAPRLQASMLLPWTTCSCCVSSGHGCQKSDDTLAEWLRRRPAKPMGSPRVGSNPTGVVCCQTSRLAWPTQSPAQGPRPVNSLGGPLPKPRARPALGHPGPARGGNPPAQRAQGCWPENMCASLWTCTRHFGRAVKASAC